MNAIPSTPAPLARHEIYAALCNYLPPPSPDTAEARAVRDERAIAAAIALRPADAAEAELAAQIVGADFHAKDALTDASRPNLTVEALKNYRAQASLMARTCQGAIRSLLSLQAAASPSPPRLPSPSPRRPPNPHHRRPNHHPPGSSIRWPTSPNPSASA